MENFLVQMAELLEVDSVNAQDEITSFEAWDSLTALSIIAFVGDEYNITLTVNEILDAKTINELYHIVKSNG
jgi:acyl carrier protein